MKTWFVRSHLYRSRETIHPFFSFRSNIDKRIKPFTFLLFGSATFRETWISSIHVSSRVRDAPLVINFELDAEPDHDDAQLVASAGMNEYEQLYKNCLCMFKSSGFRVRIERNRSGMLNHSSAVYAIVIVVFLCYLRLSGKLTARRGWKYWTGGIDQFVCTVNKKVRRRPT